MIKGELHLFILWEKGQDQKDRIVNDIRKNFSLLKMVDVLWAPQYFHENLARFYGKKLKKSYKKDKTIGTGMFTVFIVCDQEANKHTVGGVNTKMVNFKKKYREWLGGNLLHASDGTLEGKENLLFLFKMSEPELKANYKKLPSVYNQGALAERGFKSQKDFNDTLKRLPFDVKCISENVYRSTHPVLMARLINAKPRKFLFIQRKGKYTIQVANKKVNIQLI